MSYGIIFLFVLILGITSVSVTNMMSKKNVEYAETIVPAVEEIGLARRNMLSVRRYLLNAIITNDVADYQRVQQAMTADRDALYASLDAIETINPAYGPTIDSIREKLQGVATYNDQIMELSYHIGDTVSEDQAYDIYLNSYAPAFTEAADMIIALNDQIDQDILAQEAMVKNVRTVAIVLVIVIAAAALAAVIVLTLLMLRYLLVPTRKLLDGAEALAKGDFQNAAVDYPCQDEFGILAGKITQVMNRIVFIIKDLQMGLQAIEDGRFDARSSDDSQYEGEYHYLRDSVYHLIRMLNDIMCKIHSASNEVSNGADQVAGAAQALSQGSTQQASSVEELAASLERVDQIIRQLAEQAGRVAANSQAQDDAIHQITLGVDQISAVVQNNSATAEESAAASQELSGQANLLRDLVSKFTIRCQVPPSGAAAGQPPA